MTCLRASEWNWTTTDPLFPSRNNNNLIPGVIWHRKRFVWKVTGLGGKHLYWGLDFFEACCRRKSYELLHPTRFLNLTDDKIMEIYKAKGTTRQLAKVYGINKDTIARIKRGEYR